MATTELKQVEDYGNGDDMLVKVDGKAVGHCTSTSVSFSTETKDRAVKPAFDQPRSTSRWKGKTITGLSISISFEGLRFWKETEGGYDSIASSWGAGQQVEVECFYRGEESPYLKGMFVIDSLEESGPSQDDITYSGSLSNSGEPEIYPGKAS